MIQLSCHCGQVELRLAHSPEYLTQCNCSLCERYGALWAYYVPDQVSVKGPSDQLQTYCQGDKTLDLHFCKTCGCVTHWAPLIAQDIPKMGVNMRLCDLDQRQAWPIKTLNGRAF